MGPAGLRGFPVCRESHGSLSHDSINPYQAPPATNDDPLPRPTPRGSWRMSLVLAIVGAIAFHGFTLMLLTSGSGIDFNAGVVFLLNSPPFVLWIVLLVRKNHHAAKVGLTIVPVQLAITVIMLLLGIGDVSIVCMINGGIMAAMGVLVAICWKKTVADSL